MVGDKWLWSSLPARENIRNINLTGLTLYLNTQQLEQEEMDEHSCCLCKEALVQDKRRRRKLHGSSCARIKQQLQTLSPVPLESLFETADSNAYLCNACEAQLKAIATFEARLIELKSKVIENLSQLLPILSSPVEAPRGRKRLLYESSEMSQKCQCSTPCGSTDAAASTSRDEDILSPTHPTESTLAVMTDEISSSPQVQVRPLGYIT